MALECLLDLFGCRWHWIDPRDQESTLDLSRVPNNIRPVTCAKYFHQYNSDKSATIKWLIYEPRIVSALEISDLFISNPA